MGSISTRRPSRRRFGNVVGQTAGDVTAKLFLTNEVEHQLMRQASHSLLGRKALVLKTKRRIKRDGTYAFSYEGEVAGMYRGMVYINGSPIDTLEFRARLLPTTLAPLKCVVSAEGVTKVRAGDRQQVHIEVRDLYGNRKEDGGDK